MLSPVRSTTLSSYRIPKDEVAVEIALRYGEPESMTVFLGARAASHPGRERPSDLLLDDGVFLTAVGSDERVRFLHKDAIAWMTVAPEFEMSGRCETESQLSSHRCRPIDLLLDDGRTFLGKVAIMMPPESSRLQDYLNAAGRFIEVRGDGGFHFVNRDRIAMVTATE
ncbi:MAG: hypothetical protein WBG86_20565 [Polyangiales bacterium]